MIYIIKEGLGEYEDHYEIIIGVYDIPEKINIQKFYKDYLEKEYIKAGVILEYNKYGWYFPSKNYQENNKIIKELKLKSINLLLEEKYNIKSLEFIDYTI